jgi:integrase
LALRAVGLGLIRIIQGDCRAARAGILTSPPYWGLPDYGVAGQIGLESDYRTYVATMVKVFRAVRQSSTSGVSAKRGLPHAPHLRAHRVRQLEDRVARGHGKPEADPLVLCEPDGSAVIPDRLSQAWRSFVRSKGLPPVNFHSLRHVHASGLIAAGVNILQVAKRLGHSNPKITLGTYGHVLDHDDGAAARTIEPFLKR